MQRKSVSSSNIAEIGYDESSQILEVMFKSGSVYQYFDVPSHEYRDLMAASSFGSHFHQYIRGYYRYARV